MKRILSVLLALVMVIGMLPMSILSASAASVVTYEKVTTTPTSWDGNYLIVYEDGSGNAYVFNGKDEAKGYVKASYSNAVIEHSSELEALEVTFATVDGGVSLFSKVQGKYMYSSSSSSNKLAFKDAADAHILTVNSDGTVTVNSSNGVPFQFNKNSNDMRFRYYYKKGQQPVCLYQRVETATDCTHEGTVTTTTTNAATCTEAGSTVVKCECGYTISTTEIPALGHAYGDFVITTEATCTTAGVKTQTCANGCGIDVVEEIPATGHTYVEGVCACGASQANVVSYKEVTTDDITAGEYIIAGQRAAANYPNVYPATGTCSGDWTVVENPVAVNDGVITSDMFSGAQVFVLTGDNTNGFTIGYNNGTEMVYLGVSNYTDNRKLAFSADYGNVLWTLGTADKGGYSLNHAFTDASGNAANYAISDNSAGTASIRGYKSGATYYGIYLFKEVVGDVVDPDPDVPTEPSDEHADCDITEVKAKEPTCTEEGNTAGKYCNDCDEYFDGYEVIKATGHNYVDGICTNCKEAEPDVGTDENVEIVFELGDNGSASHSDGKTATEYTETVDGYTLNITATDKMYTGAIDEKGNSCIKLGTGSVAGGFTIAVPDNVTSVVISVAGYKKNTVTVTVNGASTAIGTLSDDGVYTAITVDTSTTKTVKFETTTTGYRAMVNSIKFVVSSGSETGHTCVWDEGTVTTVATCLAEGVMTYNCTIEGCEKYKTEAIAKTDHDMVNGICSVCKAEYYTLSTTLNNNDSVIIYYPTSKVAMSAAASNKKLAAANVTIDESGMLTNSDVAIMQVQYLEGSETDFYLICDGKYLTSAATGNGLSFADSASEYAVWYIEVVEDGNSTVFIHSRNAEYNGSSQSMEFYSGFTTYGTKTTEIYQFQLYTKAENAVACEHEWGEWQTVTEASCTTAGEQKSVCSKCQTEKTQIIAATGHTYVFGDAAITCGACNLNLSKLEIVAVPKTVDGNQYYVEGIVTFVDGGTVYIQDATGGVALRLASGVTAPAVGEKVEAIGTCSDYNALIQLKDAYFETVSADNTVEAQQVTVTDLVNDTDLDYLSEKVSLKNVEITEVGTYNSTYKNVDYTVTDGTNTIKLYRTPAASADTVLAVGDKIDVIAVVSTYNGYQLRVVAESDITKAVTVPSISITHISLDAGKDALGFKAELVGIDPADVTEYGFEFSVNNGPVTTLTHNKDTKALESNNISARINKIMASNGGEKDITGRAFVVVNGEKIYSESQTTSMMKTILAVNELTNLSDAQKAAVYGLYEQYAKTMDAWLSETNNIKDWTPATEPETPAA